MRVRTIAQQTIRTHKLLALSIGLLALPVQAQKPALEAHVQMRVPRLRSLAPIPIEVRLSWQGKNLLEGHLRYELLSGPQTVAVYNTGDLALNTGDQRFHFLLPPVSDPNLSNQLLLKLSLIDRYGRIYPLGDHALGTQQSSGRSFVVAIASHLDRHKEVAVKQAHHGLEGDEDEDNTGNDYHGVGQHHRGHRVGQLVVNEHRQRRAVERKSNGPTAHP